MEAGHRGQMAAQRVAAGRRGSGPSRRYRSAVACEACRRRKVRCSYMVTGAPCSYCIQDGVSCLINTQRTQTYHSPKSRNPSIRSHSMRPQQNAVGGSNASLPTMSSLDNLMLAAGIEKANSDFRTTPTADAAGNANASTDNRPQEESDEHNVAGLARSVLGDQEDEGDVPYFVGEPQGSAYLLDIVEPHRQTETTHVLIPALSSKSIDPEDLNYLKAKGVFSLPGPEVCKSLLFSYFHHVHPIMPVVDAQVFLKSYFDRGPEGVNLLLLWSMFFVAANFLSADVRLEAGFTSVKEMKRKFYVKAKCLFDAGMETEKTVPLQSSLLLSFWHSEPDVHFQPWYWSGVAIHYCQFLGLYRDSYLHQRSHRLDHDQCRIWCRIWWTCVFRDRWLSLTLGRPLRIDMASCSAPMPSTNDFFDGPLDPSHIRTYLPDDLSRLAQFWVKLIRLSNLLGDVLVLNYKFNRPVPTTQEINTLECDILQESLDIAGETRCGSRVATFYAYHYQLHYQAVLVVLYRPYTKRVPSDLDPINHDGWRATSLRKIIAAASQTNNLLSDIVSSRLLGYAGPMTPALIVPAMHNHLLCSATSDQFASQLALNKLDFCLIVMRELQHTYEAAGLFRAIFSEAIRKLHPDNRSDSSSDNNNNNETTAVETPALMNQIDLDIGNNAFLSRVGDAVFDGPSVFSFWDTPLMPDL